MTPELPEMLDVVFEISGDSLPVSYAFGLWDELVRLLPQLQSDERIGVVPLRLSASREGLLLPRRTKLVLRLPPVLAESANLLAQQVLQVGTSVLRLGTCKIRAISHYPTLHAHLVTGASDELVFMQEMASALAAMRVEANLICGRYCTQRDGVHVSSGYSLVLHDLSPQDSLRLQYSGLGHERRFGCGIFVPYKVISGLE